MTDLSHDLHISREALVAAERRADEAARAVAAMRSTLEWIRDGQEPHEDEDEDGTGAECNDVGDGCLRCAAVIALSTPIGSGWLRPEEHAKVLAELRATVPPPEVWQNLQRQAGELRAELMNIARAKRFDRERFSSADDFAGWAQSRASFTLDHNDAGSGWLSPEQGAEKVAAEREACALIADGVARGYGSGGVGRQVSRTIAFAIRSRCPVAAHPTENR